MHYVNATENDDIINIKCANLSSTNSILYNWMSAKYKYYLITGFVPTYEQRDGLRMTPGHFDDESISAAKTYYASLGARLPITRKLVEYDTNTSLYFLQYSIDDIVLMLRTVRSRDAIIAYDGLRYLLAFVHHQYCETRLVPLTHKPHFSNTQIQDLFDRLNSDYMHEFLGSTLVFQTELRSGFVISHREVLELRPQLREVFRRTDVRRSLACFYQSQVIYYTHLVGSYVASHSRPELIGMGREEFVQHNFQYQEMLHASLLACYRGIEALYSKNFRSDDFKKVNRSKLQSHMDAKVPNAPSRSRYRLRFYRQRETRPPKHKLIITTLEVLFRARNRAAHGHRWTPIRKLETFGSDLVDESKFFLAHLISNTLW